MCQSNTGSDNNPTEVISEHPDITNIAIDEKPILGSYQQAIFENLDPNDDVSLDDLGGKVNGSMCV